MINSTLEFLYGLHNRGIKLGLENITDFLKLCNNPHNKIKTIHLAGTNGKGSTASILAKILQENGKKVGLYTSPHLVRFNERIRINGYPISDQEIIDFIQQHQKTIMNQSITFFEATTALAFSFFEQNNVDIAIIETGLGGRLDSTNVIKPIQTIITEIDYDHTHILGESIDLIAIEKCGILKKNIPVLTSNSNKEVLDTIEYCAYEKKSPLTLIDKNTSTIIQHTPQSISFLYDGKKFVLPQAGSYQKNNAILAIETCKAHFPKINMPEIQSSLQKWVWPGRMQIMAENIFYDVAHNTNAIEKLSEDLYSIYNKKPIGLLILKNDKFTDKLLTLLHSQFKELIISTIDSKDILQKDDILNNNQLQKFKFIDNITKALSKLQSIDYNGPKVIFGSHYIAKDLYSFFDFSFDNGAI
jgi:dihydrofolate synthase/folylpolyglutamate synthase